MLIIKTRKRLSKEFVSGLHLLKAYTNAIVDKPLTIAVRKW